MAHNFRYIRNIPSSTIVAEVEKQNHEGYELTEWQHGWRYSSMVFKIADPIEQAKFGNLFRAFGKFTAIAAAATVNVQIKTGAKSLYVTAINIAPDAEQITTSLIEDPTITDGTTEVISYNANRNSVIVPTATFYNDPSAISGGTKIEELFLPGSAGVGQTRSGDRFTEGGITFILKPSSDVVLEIVNGGSGAVDVGWNVSWFEVGA